MPLSAFQLLTSAPRPPTLRKPEHLQTSSDERNRVLPQLQERKLHEMIDSFSVKLRSDFFSKVQYKENEGPYSSLAEAFERSYICPVLIAANTKHHPSFPELRAQAVPYSDGTARFEFRLSDLPYPNNSPSALSELLPIVLFITPGTLNARAQNPETEPTDSTPYVKETAQMARRYVGRDVICTDTDTAFVLRWTSEPSAGEAVADNSKLLFTPSVDLKRYPLRLVIAALISDALGSGHYFSLPFCSPNFVLPSGALNHVDLRTITIEDAMQRWSQKSDIDWYTACNDATYRTVVSHWMRENLLAHQGSPAVSRGDVLRMRFSPDGPNLRPRPIYAKEPLPVDTASFLEETRRNTNEAALKEKLETASEWEVRILSEIDSSNTEDGASFACEVASVGGVVWEEGSRFRIKIFDDRRMGDLDDIEEETGVLQWHHDATFSQSDILVGLEDAAYRRMDHAQGSIVPFYYGVHEVVLPDGVCCWAILTEFFRGDTPQSLPRDVPTDVKSSVVAVVRHALRGMEYADISKPRWRFGDIRIHFFQGSSPRAPPRPGCNLVNLWRARFSTLDGSPDPNDDYGEVWSLLAVAFGEEIVGEWFGEREFWDYHADSMNVYIGDDWVPEDYDPRYYEVSRNSRRSH